VKLFVLQSIRIPGFGTCLLALFLLTYFSYLRILYCSDEVKKPLTKTGKSVV
jgi:hypothetical protein